MPTRPLFVHQKMSRLQVHTALTCKAFAAIATLAERSGISTGRRKAAPAGCTGISSCGRKASLGECSSIGSCRCKATVTEGICISIGTCTNNRQEKTNNLQPGQSN